MALVFLRAMPGVAFLVARTADMPVAGCIIGDRYRGNLRIMNVAVAPAARRRGIGTALLRAVEAAIPAGDVMLMAEQWNTGAQELYEREGYTRHGVARDYYGKNRHGIRMTKKRAASDTENSRIVV
jgi:ribosomal-protein-alanine N-acetyltransferase